MEESPPAGPGFEEVPVQQYEPSVMEACSAWVGAMAGPVAVAAVVAWLAYQRARPALLRWWGKRQEACMDARLAKDPDLLMAREAAVEAARQRMQQRYSAASAVQEERRRQREEEKKRAAQEACGARPGEGRRLGEAEAGAAPAPPQPAQGGFNFRREYNPLMGGAGGSCGWRPARRGGARGG